MKLIELFNQLSEGIDNVYHATNADFDSFDTQRGEMGSHFGTINQVNDIHDSRHDKTGSNIGRFNLDIKNPIRLIDHGDFSPSYVIPQLIDKGIPFSDEEMSAFVLEPKYPEKEITKIVQQRIMDAGYDGIVYLNRMEGIGDVWDDMDYPDEEMLQRYPHARDSYIAFNNDQIRPFNESLLENNGNFVYHVTFTEYIPKIMKQGLRALQTSNWKRGNSDERYNEDGGIFSFDNPKDAIRWAWKQNYEFHQPTSIIKAIDAGDWDSDPAENVLLGMHGKALKKHSPVDPKSIVDVIAFTEFEGMMIGTDQGMEKAAKLLETVSNLTGMVLLEDRVDYLRKTFEQKVIDKFNKQGDHVYSQADEIFDAIIGADPTPQKKFVQWIIKIYLNNRLKLEDLYKVLEYLDVFIKHNRTLPQEYRDINRYQSLTDLYQVVKGVQDKEVISNKQQERVLDKKMHSDDQIELVYNSPTMKVVIPLTEEASCYFGRNTQWCTAATAGNNLFGTYHEDGNLYIVLIKKENKRFQFHIASREISDEEDREVSLEKLIDSYPEITKAFTTEQLTRLASIGYHYKRNGSTINEYIKNRIEQVLDDVELHILGYAKKDDAFVLAKYDDLETLVGTWTASDSDANKVLNPELANAYRLATIKARGIDIPEITIPDDIKTEAINYLENLLIGDVSEIVRGDYAYLTLILTKVGKSYILSSPASSVVEFASEVEDSNDLMGMFTGWEENIEEIVIPALHKDE